MSWVTLLWAGLLAAGLPLWIHRMQRRGTVRLPISSISLIRSGRDRARRQWSRDRSLLFWIRLAALGFLALGLAMIFPGELSEPVDVPGAEAVTQPASESMTGSTSSSDGSDRMVVALVAEPEVAGPLTTAIRLLGETRPLQLDSSAANHPQLWSRQRRLVGSEDVQEVWLQQGWTTETAGSEEWMAWVRAGGHLVVTIDAETSVVTLNRWLSTAGQEIRVEPARERVMLSTGELNRWLGEELYGRSVDTPRMDLPDLFPERVLRGGNSDNVLLRSEGGDPLVWRGSLGEGWITLSVLDWEEGPQTWIHHPLFPLLLNGLLTLSEAVRDEWTMETGGDTLTTREEPSIESTLSEKETPQSRVPWRVWIGIGLALLLTESVAGRYLSERKSSKPPR